MKIRRFVFGANQREVVSLSKGRAELVVPADVPFAVLEKFRRRIRDRIARPLAWKRLEARLAIREEVRRRHGRVHIRRHEPVREPRVRRGAVRRSVCFR